MNRLLFGDKLHRRGGNGGSAALLPEKLSDDGFSRDDGPAPGGIASPSGSPLRRKKRLTVNAAKGLIKIADFRSEVHPKSTEKSELNMSDDVPF
jgi:hypothetical protein